MGRRSFRPAIDHLERRLPPGSLAPPTAPVDVPDPGQPPNGVPTIIAPVPPPDPFAPVIA